MVEVDIPRSLFEEQGRELYGAQLLQIQVIASAIIFFSGHSDFLRMLEVGIIMH